MRRAIFGVAGAAALLGPATVQAHQEATGIDPWSHELFHLLVGPPGVLLTVGIAALAWNSLRQRRNDSGRA